MSPTQQFILELLKEGREYLKTLAPFLTALVTLFIPSPLSRKKKDEQGQ